MNPNEVRKLHDRLIKHFYDFYRYTDSAHRIDHIRSVMSNVIRICYMQGWQEHLKLALIAAAAHDIFSTKEHRTDHHIKAFTWIMDNKPVMMRKYKLNYEECYTVAYAAMEHRGSFKGNYNSIVSEIVAAADRGIPSKEDVVSYLSRSYLYARDSQCKSITDAKFHAVNHIQDKFGRNAYAKVPDWYGEIFAAQLAERLEIIEHLDIDFFTAEMVEELEQRLKH
ncbi:hypothetical protein pEaSNUABM8_00278 [Erwinia phage pEa_SNUABM_8]|nr:hypothetical protein pEaSNUABM8_00278 [Erwinia phage pEa_SNUABM_8]QVW55030.1 hypothetical protein pEaSNUABM4_00277 [Erwinia phage pEa_SNUABM_4]